MKQVGLTQLRPRLFVQAGVLHRHSDLAREGKDQMSRFFVVGIGMVRVHHQHTDDPVLVDQRHTQPRAHRAKSLDREPAGLFVDVWNDDWTPLTHDPLHRREFVQVALFRVRWDLLQATGGNDPTAPIAQQVDRSRVVGHDPLEFVQNALQQFIKL